MPIFPSGFDQNASPATTDKILVADVSNSNKTEWSEIGNLPFPEMQTDTFQYKTSITVGFSDADYICDGTDDDVQIQEAMVFAKTNKCEIKILAGEYNLNAQLLMYDGMAISGTNLNDVIFNYLPATGSCFIKESTVRIYSVNIKNITIDCFDNGGHGLNLTQVSMSYFENVYVINANKALILDTECYYNMFVQCFFISSVVGIDATNNANQNTFIGGWLKNNVTGLRVYGGIDTIKFFSTAWESTGVVSFVSIEDTAQYINFTGCRFESGVASSTITIGVDTVGCSFVGNSYAATVVTNNSPNTARLDWNTITGFNVYPNRLGIGQAVSSLTISSGSITTTSAFHTIDTEGAAATDDLTTLVSKGIGEVVVLRIANNARTVTIKHNVNNIQVFNGKDFTLGNTAECVLMVQIQTGQWSCMPITRQTLYANGPTGLAGGQTIAGGTLTTENLTLRANSANLTTGSVAVTTTTASTSTGTGSLIVSGGVGILGAIYGGSTLNMTGSLTFTSASSGVNLKRGSNGKCGTFVANGATPVTVSNTSIAITDTIIISLNTVGGTVGAQPHINTITGGTGFTVVCTALDTSTYNYVVISNLA